MDLAVHAAVLATLSALSGFLLAALMLLTGLSLSALLLLAGLALPTLLQITLLLLLARILLFVRHVDVLHKFRKPPYDKTITPLRHGVVPTGVARTFGNELENHKKMRLKQ